jgi:sulfur-carrier protein
VTDKPSVTVRFWAGARAAAGSAEEQVQATTLAEAVAELGRQHGPKLAGVLAVCSFVVNDHAVGRSDRAEVTFSDGDVLEVLPPFAGGSPA